VKTGRGITYTRSGCVRTPAGIVIGGAYTPPAHPERTSYSAEVVQDAMRKWRERSANNSQFGGDMHPEAERRRRRVRVGKRGMLWRAGRVLRELVAWLSAPRAW
jgi:hypothetical protein